MQFTIQVVIKGEHGDTGTEDVIELNKQASSMSGIGMSLQDSKAMLKTLQKMIVCYQAEEYTKAHTHCPHCHKKATDKRLPYPAVPDTFRYCADTR